MKPLKVYVAVVGNEKLFIPIDDYKIACRKYEDSVTARIHFGETSDIRKATPEDLEELNE